MPTLLRTLRLLSIVVWVGGIIFFAFVLAPVAFHLLPTTHIAGIVVGGTLRVLDVIGLLCGFMFWGATLLLSRQPRTSGQSYYELQLLLASAMLLATAYLHLNILPTIEQARVAAGGDIEASPATNPARVRFERLHKRSEQVEGAVLLCGLGIVLLMARESLPPNAVDS